MILKYASYLQNAVDCPCLSNCVAKDITAYRFTHKNATAANFVPVAFLGNTTNTCSSYGLSFFKSVTKARKKALDLKKSYQTIELAVGTHIAEIAITQTDGVCTPFGKKSGHMDLHPKIDITFHDRILDYHEMSSPLTIAELV